MTILLILAFTSGAVAQADRLVQEDKYPEAISVLKEGEREARQNRDATTYQVLRERRAEVEKLARVWKRVERDVLHLSVDPKDPDANYRVGAFYCFLKRDFKTGLGPLSNGSNKTLAAVAAQDLNGVEQPSYFALAESWWDAAHKLGKEEAPAARARALHWYAQAWPWLSADQKAMAIPKVSAVDRNPQGRFTPKQTVRGWAYRQGEFAAGPSSEYAKEGMRSMRIDAHPTKTVYWPLNGEGIRLIPGKKYDLTAWFRTEGTNRGDHLIFQVSTADGKMALQKVLASKPDYPFWHEATTSFEAPANAVRLSVQIGMPSTEGTVWLDGVSVQEEGRERFAGGSFEP